MARGFASKNVAEQQEEALRARPARRPAEEPDVARQRRGLDLARADVLARMKTAQADAHRRLLSRSLEALDAQIAVLEGRRRRDAR